MTLNIINSLSEKIESLHSEKFSFQQSKGKGVRLIVGLDADVYNLVTEIVKDCSTVVLLKALIMDEFTSVRDYALEHFISESTVRRDMSKVQKLLERYHIEIGRENFQLQGEEYQIRMCMVIFSGAFFEEAAGPLTM